MAARSQNRGAIRPALYNGRGSRGVSMITHVDATLTNGVLKPDQPLPLADQTRVHLTIEPIEGWSREKALAAWEAILNRLKERPIHGGGRRYSRDELHERR